MVFFSKALLAFPFRCWKLPLFFKKKQTNLVVNGVRVFSAAEASSFFSALVAPLSVDRARRTIK